jgi:hypothetical protein
MVAATCWLLPLGYLVIKSGPVFRTTDQLDKDHPHDHGQHLTRPLRTNTALAMRS